jgi:hypothetical protein
MLTHSRTLGHALLVLSLVIVASACDQAQSLAPTATGAEVAPPSSRTINGPPNPGHVERFEAAFITTVFPDQDLVVRRYNTEDVDFCGGSTPFGPFWSFQDVLTPRAIIELTNSGEIPVYVYRLSEVPPVIVEDLPPELVLEFCAALKEKWLYRGTHHFISHDNDLFGSGTRMNSVTQKAEGTVFDRAGEKHAYRESFFIVWNPATGEVIRLSQELSIK